MQAVLQGLDAGQRALSGEWPAAFGDDARGGQDEGRAFGEAAADGTEAGGEFQQAGVVAGADRLLPDAGGEQRRAQVPQQGGFQSRQLGRLDGQPEPDRRRGRRAEKQVCVGGRTLGRRLPQV
ncbi:hypothetical protein ACFQY5_07275 [Paeniroseomonas aquatica]|uniref:hypothetical protein n=1 Tax=Paeniroseomonas aquatica TaxID=373043 RepID=UPI00361BF7C1